MNRRDFKKMAQVRISDAKALLKTGRNASGAYYLAGYAVECALKACFTKTVKAGDWPPKPEDTRKLYSHDLVELVKQAGLKGALDAEIGHNTSFAGHWGTVKDWSEQSRYKTYSQQDASKLFDAIADPKDGVLIWIQQYW